MPCDNKPCQKYWQNLPYQDAQSRIAMVGQPAFDDELGHPFANQMSAVSNAHWSNNAAELVRMPQLF
jgi:hypothetical protein